MSGAPETFVALAARPDPPLDRLALALAAAFGPVDAERALARIDELGARAGALVRRTGGSAEADARACAALLGAQEGFAGDRERYDDPANSMLDAVLERRRGLPILLSVLYVEVARRAGVTLHGVGLPGHFVVGHFGARPPILLDPFAGGTVVEAAPGAAVRPWGAHETAMRMLNNLVAAYRRRGDLVRAIRAAELRLALPAAPALADTLRAEHLALRARLN